MATNKIEVKGLRELEQSLLALQKEYGGKAGEQAMRPAVVAAVKPLKDQVSQETPVDQGTLRESVKMTVGKPTKAMLRSQHYNNSTIIAGRVGWFWSSPSLWTQALAVEFGTQEVAAQHVLSQIMDREHRTMLNTFKNKLGPAIEKKAKALHKKQQKG
jgi:HK97 gp10 family phage protein